MATRQSRRQSTRPSRKISAEGQEDVGGVELVAEGAGVAAGHLPGDLVAGPRLASPRRCRRRRGPAPPRRRRRSRRPPSGRRPSLARRGRAAGCSRRSLDDLRVAVGDARSLRPRRSARRGGAGRPAAADGAAAGSEEQRGRRSGRSDASRRLTARSARRTPGRRRAASTARARRRDSGPQPTKSSGPSESPRVQGAVAAAAGVADPAPVDRLVAGRERDDEVAGVRARVSADQTRASGSG